MKTRTLCLTLLAAALAAVLAPSLIARQADPGTISADEKKQVIDSLVDAMKKRYVFPDVADKANKNIQEHWKAKEYDSLKTGKEFADALAKDLNAVCKDAHLRVRYSEQTLPVRKDQGEPSAEEIKANKRYEMLSNAGFQRAERLNGNIGYIELTGFMSPEAAKAPMRAAMDFVANTDALIIDLRANGGGYPETVQMLCSYLFDGSKPVHLNDIYTREGGKTEQFWTLKSLPGKRYLNRDVYVLTSKRTGSGAEECAYDLQNLNRAMIIGESTWGGANPGGTVRLTDHFSAFIPVGRAINPYTKTNWEGTGVTPHLPVPAADALKIAQRLAVEKLLSKATGDDKARLEDVLEFIKSGK